MARLGLAMIAAAATATRPVEGDAGVAAAEIARLGDPDSAVREAAAVGLRKAIAANAGASGVRGEAYWKARLAPIKPGMSRQELEAATGAKGEGSLGGNGGTSTIFRLDDYWTVTVNVNVDRSQSVRELGPPTRSPRAVWVEPPGAGSPGSG